MAYSYITGSEILYVKSDPFQHLIVFLNDFCRKKPVDKG